MSVVDTVRLLVSLAFVGFALFQLWLMYTAEAVSHYNQWAFAAGSLLIAVGFAFISLNGEEELQTKAGSEK